MAGCATFTMALPDTTGKEVEVPAYAAMQDQPRLSARMLDILMRGVSTRQYRSVIPEMADTVGVSKSSVSRQIIEAAETEVETLLGRRFDELKLVVIYIDGMVFGDHVMIGPRSRAVCEPCGFSGGRIGAVRFQWRRGVPAGKCSRWCPRGLFCTR
jgi:hypothetical protein